MTLALGVSIPSKRGPIVGPELLLNGSFGTDTVWTKGAGWTIASGTATALTPGSTSFLTQTLPLTVGALYRIEIVVSAFVAGIVAPRFTNAGAAVGASIINISATGTYVAYTTLSATADGFSLLANSTANLSVAEVSLRRVF